MIQVIDFLIWIASGMIALFVFMCGVNLYMQKSSKRAAPDPSVPEEFADAEREADPRSSGR